MEVEGTGRQELKNAILRKFWVLKYAFIWRVFAFITVFTFLVKDFEASLLQAPGHTVLRATFWERRESEDTHEKSIFLLFRQNIPLGELIQGKIV